MPFHPPSGAWKGFFRAHSSAQSRRAREGISVCKTPPHPATTPPAADYQQWLLDEERDSCALVVNVRKGGASSHGNVKRTLEALLKMGHRTGEVDGEGDGCGLMTDIPRQLWADCLESQERPGALSLDKRFFVAHVMIPMAHRAERRRHPGAPAPDHRRGELPAPLRADRQRAQPGPGQAGPPRRAPLLAGGRHRPVGPPGPGGSPALRPAGAHGGRVAGPRGLAQRPHRGLQAARRRGVPGPVLSRAAQPRVPVLGDHRPQPLFDQHPVHLPPGAAVLHSGPQRRDQHHRQAAPGGADAGRHPGPGRQRLPGPGPRAADPHLPPRLRPDGGHGDHLPAHPPRGGAAAGSHPGGLSPLSPRLRALLPGPGRHPGALRRRLRLLGGCPGPAPPVVRRNRQGVLLQLREGRHPPGDDELRPPAAGPRREDGGPGPPRPAAGDPGLRPHPRLGDRPGREAAGAPWRKAAPAPPARRSSPPSAAAPPTAPPGSGGWPPWAGAARTWSCWTTPPAPAPSSSAPWATTAPWPPWPGPARTWPTTSRRAWRWSPTPPSTASGRWSTSRCNRWWAPARTCRPAPPPCPWS